MNKEEGPAEDYSWIEFEPIVSSFIPGKFEQYATFFWTLVAAVFIAFVVIMLFV